MKNFIVSCITVCYVCLICYLCLFTTEPVTQAPVAAQPVAAQPVARPSLIVFSATWCGPCQAAKPAIKEIESRGFKITRYDLDADRAVADKYGITSVPTFIIVDRDGTQLPGTNSVEDVQRYFQ
jgi:thiol-disulfide isomerase/thioredoxin